MLVLIYKNNLDHLLKRNLWIVTPDKKSGKSITCRQWKPLPLIRFPGGTVTSDMRRKMYLPINQMVIGENCASRIMII